MALGQTVWAWVENLKIFGDVGPRLLEMGRV